MIFVIGDNGSPEWVINDPPHVAEHSKARVYELGIRVPLIVSGPLVPTPIPNGGWRSDTLVSSVDLWSTIADITGANGSTLVPPSQLDSLSFEHVIADPTLPSNRATVFAQSFSPNWIPNLPPPSCFDLNRRGITDGEYKYIRVQLSRSPTPCGTPVYSQELYHLFTDPEETVELLSSGPLSTEASAHLAELQAELDALSGL